MPELPEVETVKNILKPLVINLKIKDVRVLRKTTIVGDVDTFINTLKDKEFLDISRIGKFLIFHLSDDIVIVSHLRMEGKYYDYLESEDDSKYARVVFVLSNGHKLCYDDSRCFGIMILSNEKEYRNLKEIKKLGPEPFVINDVKDIMKKVKKKRTPVKSALLDQTLMTGLGNIYVDETLYASKIHPLTPVCLITKQEWEEIVKNASEILNIAIEMGGSTIKSYHPGKDIDGNFQTRIKIYGKAGEKCPICGATYRFIKVGGRGTTFCPVCQNKKGSPINIGLTGKISSGKSTVLDIFKDKGYAVISSDQVVAELYQKEEVANKIEKLLKIKFPNKVVDKTILRNHLLINPKDKKRLENLIHPMVKKEVIKFLKDNKSPIRVVEVPLLFESKMDMMFDTIIAVNISKEKQLELIEARNKELAPLLLHINSTSKLDENISKASYVIENNGNKKDLANQVGEIINRLRCYLD